MDLSLSVMKGKAKFKINNFRKYRNDIANPWNHSMACSVWKVSFFTLMPWQMTRVFLSKKTTGGGCAAAVTYC